MDYAYFHDVDEEQGKIAYALLEKELGVEGMTMNDLLHMKYADRLKDETCGEDVLRFCLEHGIKYTMTPVMI